MPARRLCYKARMRRAPVLLALALAVASIAGAGCPQKKVVVVPPNPIDPRLIKHSQVQIELRKAQSKFMQTLEAYERKKQEYQIVVASGMMTSKADKRSILQIQDMSRDATRIGSELIAAVGKYNEALIARSDAARKLWTTEARLYDEEYRAFASKETAAARATAEVKFLHQAETELRLAQKEQEDIIAKLREKELESWKTIGADIEKRDQADQQLNVLRDSLGTNFVRFLDLSQKWEDAADRMHRKMHGASAKEEPEIAPKIQQLISRRAVAAKELSMARVALKDSTMLRAEKRAQEVSYDGEFDVVIARAFKTDALRENFLLRVKPQRDAMVSTRATMLEEEKGLADARMKLVALEAEIAGFGY